MMQTKTFKSIHFSNPEALQPTRVDVCQANGHLTSSLTWQSGRDEEQLGAYLIYATVIRPGFGPNWRIRPSHPLLPIVICLCHSLAAQNGQSFLNMTCPNQIEEMAR